MERNELEKLLAKGEGWLKAHPDKKLIADRYLRFKRSWTNEVLARLTDDVPEAEEEAVVAEARPLMQVKRPAKSRPSPRRTRPRSSWKSPSACTSSGSTV